jgi:hypothetical protein
MDTHPQPNCHFSFLIFHTPRARPLAVTPVAATPATSILPKNVRRFVVTVVSHPPTPVCTGGVNSSNEFRGVWLPQSSRWASTSPTTGSGCGWEPLTHLSSPCTYAYDTIRWRFGRLRCKLNFTDLESVKESELITRASVMGDFPRGGSAEPPRVPAAMHEPVRRGGHGSVSAKHTRSMCMQSSTSLPTRTRRNEMLQPPKLWPPTGIPARDLGQGDGRRLLGVDWLILGWRGDGRRNLGVFDDLVSI